MKRNTTNFRCNTFTTKGGELARKVEEFDTIIGAAVENRITGKCEAWPNFPYGPITEHENWIEAVRELRRKVRAERPWLKVRG